MTLYRSQCVYHSSSIEALGRCPKNLPHPDHINNLFNKSYKKPSMASVRKIISVKIDLWREVVLQKQTKESGNISGPPPRSLIVREILELIDHEESFNIK